MCALSDAVRKNNSAVFDNRPVCASLISNQGHREEMGRNRPVCEENVFLPRIGLKSQTGRNTVEMQVFLWRNVSLMLPYREL